MNDSELSLAVARIMWPEREPFLTEPSAYKSVWVDAGIGFFDHTTDDALGKMCVWLARKECGDLEGTQEGINIYNGMLDWMASDNPYRAIAEAILEAA